MAQEHADRAFALAIKSGNPYLRVYTQACRGLSHTIAGRLNSAIEDLSSALGFARSRKAGLENEARILADLANAYRLNGDAATALATVNRGDRGRDCAPRPGAGMPRPHRARRSSDAFRDQRTKAPAGGLELQRARKLVEETGARIFAAVMDSANAEAGIRQLTSKAK